MSTVPRVVVHGGAGRVHPSLHAQAVAQTARASAVAMEALEAGADAEEAAVRAVRVMEDSPPFNAGLGACMTVEGTFETDAGLMRSRDGAIGAVASVPDLADPISLARWVMDRSEHALICGDGAARLGRAHGVGRFGRDQLWTQKAQDRWDAARRGSMDKDGLADTVGAVVMDAHGDLCAAGSTGGVLLKLPGRIGDTPVPGAGFFASETLGACVATGKGEAMLGDVFCLRLLETIHREGEDGSPMDVAARACRDLRARTGAAVGVVGITPGGVVFVAHACPHMSWSARGEGLPDELVGGLEFPPRLSSGT